MLALCLWQRGLVLDPFGLWAFMSFLGLWVFRLWVFPDISPVLVKWSG
jgi:hypothetical protein